MKFHSDVKTDVNGVTTAVYMINDKAVGPIRFYTALCIFLLTIITMLWYLLAEFTYHTINFLSKWSGGVIPRMSFTEACVLSAIVWVVHAVMSATITTKEEKL